MSILNRIRTGRGAWVSAALVTTGLAAGSVLGTTMTAGATTTPTSSTPSSSSSGSTAPTGAPPSGAWTPPAYHVPGDSGTVTAVGGSTVTINGTVYQVTSSSDIDKNGEATLSDLKVGDAVTFDTVSSAATPTIGHLHAGSESLDRPTGPPQGGMGGPQGGPGTPSAGTGTSTVG